MNLFRPVIAALIVLGLAQSPALADEPERYASLVIDLQTEDVLHARNADELRYPASLTKMMTLYMVFDALESGDIELDDKIRVSRHASQQPPSKFWLREGDTITVEEAINALVTKSANDVAAAVAEHLGGTEARFANMMTAKARKLGMDRTRFRNASGLPDEDQVTTARDMYRLSKALFTVHNAYYGYFQTAEYEYRGRAYKNHNSLLGDVKGVDGIKTGYTRASGFNLASSVERDGRRLIAVVMGGSTSRVRDSHMRDLIERAYDAIDAGEIDPVFMALNDNGTPSSGFLSTSHGRLSPTLTSDPAEEMDEQTIALASLELRNPAVQGSTDRRGVKIVFADDAGEANAAEAAAIEAETVVETEPEPAKPAPVRITLPQDAASPASEARILTADAEALAKAVEETPLPRKIAKVTFPAEAEAKASDAVIVSSESASEPTLADVFKGGWQVQVGAFGSEARAKAVLGEIQDLSLRSLGVAVARIEPVDDTLSMYRARFAGLSMMAAARVCEELASQNRACFPVSP